MTTKIDREGISELLQYVVQPVIDVVVVGVTLELGVKIIGLLCEQRFLFCVVELNGLNGHRLRNRPITEFTCTLLFTLCTFGVFNGASLVRFRTYTFTVGNLCIFPRPAFVDQGDTTLRLGNAALLNGKLTLFLCHPLLLKRVGLLLFGNTLLFHCVFALPLCFTPGAVGLDDLDSKRLGISYGL